MDILYIFLNIIEAVVWAYYLRELEKLFVFITIKKMLPL